MWISQLKWYWNLSPRIHLTIKPALALIITWRQIGNKPSSVPMMAWLLDAYIWHSASISPDIFLLTHCGQVKSYGDRNRANIGAGNGLRLPAPNRWLKRCQYIVVGVVLHSPGAISQLRCLSALHGFIWRRSVSQRPYHYQSYFNWVTHVTRKISIQKTGSNITLFDWLPYLLDQKVVTETVCIFT